MLNKVVLVFMVIMLSGGVLNPSQRSGHTTQVQEPAYPLRNKSEIRTVQQRLTNRGFDTKGTDGIAGKNTKNAIRKFQQQMGYPVDGQATTRLSKQLAPGYREPSIAQEPGYEDNTFGSSTVVAGGVGAVIGAGVGAILGGGKGAAIGAGVGAAVGVGTDVVVNKVRRNNAENEQNLNLSIEQVRKENEDLRRMINTSKQLIEEDKSKLNRMRNLLEHRELSARNAKKQFAQLDKSRKMLEGTYNQLLAKKKERQDYANNNNTSQDMDQEMRQLNNEIALLKTQLDELDQLRSITVMG